MLEAACPQEGKAQDHNILRGTGGAQGRGRERRLCASSGPPLQPTALLTAQGHLGQVTRPL